MDRKEQDNNGSSEEIERREFTRFPVNLQLKFKTRDTNQEKEALICDISAKGMGIWTDQKLADDAILEMWVEIPNNGQVTYSEGKVVWSREVQPHKHRVGISLEKVDLIGTSLILRATYGSDWL